MLPDGSEGLFLIYAMCNGWSKKFPDTFSICNWLLSLRGVWLGNCNLTTLFWGRRGSDNSFPAGKRELVCSRNVVVNKEISYTFLFSSFQQQRLGLTLCLSKTSTSALYATKSLTKGERVNMPRNKNRGFCFLCILRHGLWVQREDLTSGCDLGMLMWTPWNSCECCS